MIDEPADTRLVVRPSATPDLPDLPDLPARLRALDAAADRYLEDGRVAGTRQAYAQDWAAWTDYTRWAGIPLLSGGRGALVGFVLWCEQGGPPCLT